MTIDRPFLGILLMIGFCAVAPLGDATAKILGSTIPLVQLLVARFAMQAVLFLPLILAAGTPVTMSRQLLGYTFLRTVLHVAGLGALIVALRYLPLAEVTAIAFVMPFIMLLLGWLVLGEEVGPRRVGACAVGFGGTLLVIQPSFAEVGWPALLPLAVALTFSLYMLVSRRIAKECDPLVLQTVSGFMGTAMLLLVLAAGGGRDDMIFGLVMPDAGGTWLLLLAIGVLGAASHLLMTWSLRFAPSATVAPVQYLEIPVATLIGWLIFADLPNGLAALGIAITMAAGLYILVRERGLARLRPAEA